MMSLSETCCVLLHLITCIGIEVKEMKEVSFSKISELVADARQL